MRSQGLNNVDASLIEDASDVVKIVLNVVYHHEEILSILEKYRRAAEES